MAVEQKITEDSVKKFKRDVVGACPSLVTLQEQHIARSIPQGVFEKVLVSVFNGDNQLARDIMYNRFDRIKDTDAEKEVEMISTLIPASVKIAKSVRESNPILLISDIDNDGSLAQALGMEFMRITNHHIDVMPRDYDPGNHGYSINQIKSWLNDSGHSYEDDFVVIVSDLGTNQRDTQQEFIGTFPNAQLIVADHHKPDIDMMMRNDNERTLLVSPFIKGSMRLGIRGGGGASGGFLTYELFKHAILFLKESRHLEMTDLEFKNRIEPMKLMGKAANLLDNVECDIRLKPLHEKEVSKALDVASLTNKGKTLGKWASVDQIDNIKSLSSLIGDEAVEELLETRNRMVEQNHFAWALFEVIPYITDKVGIDEDGEDKKPEKIHVPNKVTELIASKAAEENANVNYIELLRPYIFNLKYENQFEGSVKKSWLSLAEKIMSEIGKVEKNILQQIRSFQLVKEASDDFITITQAASNAVSSVFTVRQLNSAYHSLSKSVNMSVSRSSVGQIVLSYKSEIPIRELLFGAENSMPELSFVVRGHDNVGGLTVHMPPNTSPEKVIHDLVKSFNVAAKNAIDNKPLAESLEVKPIHLSIIKEMLQKMRVDIVRGAEPNLLMRLAPNMTFEDSKTLEKLPVSKLIEKKEWETTTESLDFAMTSSLLLPNQAMKTVANDNFEGALKISLLPNGSYMATKALTGAQLRQMDISVMRTPLQKERDELKASYKKLFKDKELPMISLDRKEGMDALKFTNDGGKVFRNTEAVILSVLNRSNHESYVVLDVEADGGGNAKCFNVGLAIYKPEENSGHILSLDDFNKLVEENEDKIDNFRKLDNGDFIVNERLKCSLVSQIISRDGSKPISISFKTQNLTNIDQDFLDEVGCSSEDAEAALLRCLNYAGKFIIQAHNLPYDNNIMEVNFPEIFKLMQASTHLDTAPLAMRHQIAYTNVQTNTIAGVEFFNAEHSGYNLSTLFATEKSFNYPSIKGTHVLQVRDDVVQILDLKTRVTTRLDKDRYDLEGTLLNTLSPLKKPKYGIQKLMKMAAIHDLISHQPVKQVVKVDYESFGMKPLSDELWDHFQENYAYDMTPSQNVAKFIVIPEVQELLSQDTVFENYEDIDPELLKARNLGKGAEFDPDKKIRAKKDQAAHDEKVRTVGFESVLQANALNFVRANPENAERFARAWLYELVLDHHEPTRKDMPKSFISGVSEMTGIDENMVSIMYDEIYIYKKFRNIQTISVHETHNNIGPEGDTFQEVNVFIHMLYIAMRNPFITGKIAKKHGMSPFINTVDIMLKQAAESTLRQMTRDALKTILNDDVLNNYSAKQLDNFSQDGVSMAVNRNGIAKMRCKSLSDNKAEVHIELPKYSAKDWRDMPSESRFEIEEQLEMAVTTILLYNSRKEKILDENGSKLLEELSTSPESIELIKEMQEYFEVLKPTKRDSLIKSTMKAGVDAILGNEALKLPINQELTISDLAVVKSALEDGIKRLAEEQNFSSFLEPEDLYDAFEKAKSEFLAFDHLYKEKEKLSEVSGYEPFPTATKSLLTKTLTKLEGVSELHFGASPDLAERVLATKKDPMDFLLKSPMIYKLMEVMSPAPEQGLDLGLTNDLSSNKLKM